MFWFTELKHSKDPYQFGSVIRGYKKCGKKNCRCFTRGELHKYHYLKWRDSDSVVHKKYVRKSDVNKLEYELAEAKGYYIWNKLSWRQQSYFLMSDNGFHPKYVRQIVYQIFKKPPYPIDAK